MVKVQLVCSKCGADGEGSCECGEPYMPKKLKAAVEAIRVTPSLSTRAVAEQINISHMTVQRAHKIVAEEKAGVTNNVTTAPKQEVCVTVATPTPEPEKRQGKDGKMYPVQKAYTKPYTSGINEVVNFINWLDDWRFKIRTRFQALNISMAETKAFDAQSRDVLADAVKYFRRDLEKCMNDLDAIELTSDDSKIVTFRKAE